MEHATNHLYLYSRRINDDPEYWYHYMAKINPVTDPPQ